MLGVDLVKVDRIEKLLEKFGDNFLKRIFTKEEIEYIQKKQKSKNTVAGMYASKEAVSKALGTGIGEVGFKEIAIEYNPYPRARVGEKVFELSISHDGDYAVAVCMLK
ncbi:holo-ACP synthase [Peptoniphilus indolicus]|uniref:Holo-(Acyl-carrier-protein) synthase n=2 Tax=Peptoniphilus indolicus TaxID=33030 RepID=G4D3C3_9FIRM|nr:holo-ACP synthase [Peptoniphilus indolicus]EGY79969.1 holo-(acyl-carrier-protein) synthase [Peptoniphilus indolicus ATCC 29427]SUB75015.1 Holo-[acyl-carrier-protein] synthase [Peptoniphilus indolicus]